MRGNSTQAELSAKPSAASTASPILRDRSDGQAESRKRRRESHRPTFDLLNFQAQPLSEALEARRLDRVTGSGTQMSREGSAIVWVGIDLELADLEGALTFARDRLRQLGAPPGSVLEFRVGEENRTVQIA